MNICKYTNNIHGMLIGASTNIHNSESFLYDEWDIILGSKARFSAKPSGVIYKTYYKDRNSQLAVELGKTTSFEIFVHKKVYAETTSIHSLRVYL